MVYEITPKEEIGLMMSVTERTFAQEEAPNILVFNNENYNKKYRELSHLFSANIPNELLKCLEQIAEQNSYYLIRINEKETAQRVKDLYVGLKQKFKRLPMIFPYIVEMIDEFNIELLIQRFHVKSMRFALSLKEEIPSIYHRIKYGIMFEKRIYEVIFHLKNSVRDLNSFVAGMPGKYPIVDKELENWVISHAGKTKNETIHEVMTFWNDPQFPKHSTLEEQKLYFGLNRKEIEWERCVKKYPNAFQQPFSCRLKYLRIEIGEEKAYILEPNDKKQVLLGILSVCCQRLDGDAEASMMEGLLNPYSGFLVFERGEKLLGQSWVWLSSDEKTLVLDNIELAENRSPLHILHLLKEWVHRSPYENIQMGIGFNPIIIGANVEKKDICWYNQIWSYRYTDANERVWLKRNHIITI